MGLAVFWTPKAIDSYNQVIDYLIENWPEKVRIDFAQKVDRTIALLETGTISFRTVGHKDLQEVLITKHNLLIYRVKKTNIELLRFYDTRQHPDKKKL